MDILLADKMEVCNFHMNILKVSSRHLSIIWLVESLISILDFVAFVLLKISKFAVIFIWIFQRELLKQTWFCL